MPRRTRGPRRPSRPRKPRKPPKAPSTPPTLRLHEHGALSTLPELTRQRLKWLAGLLDMPEVNVIALAVKHLVDDYDDSRLSDYDDAG